MQFQFVLLQSIQKRTESIERILEKYPKKQQYI